MKSNAHVYSKTKNIGGTFDARMAIRNILFALVLSACYLLARQYYINHAPSIKINNIMQTHP
jgi:hypothetical protein